MRPIALIPLTCAITGFILGLLSVLAGKSGFMQDYHIMTINTTMLGKNLLPTTISQSPRSLNAVSTSERSLGDAISSGASSLESAITSSPIGTAASSLESAIGTAISSGTAALASAAASAATSAAGAAISAGGSALGAAAGNVTSALEKELGNLINGTVTDISKALGIKQWYSFHVMNMCEGAYLASTQAGGSSGFNTSTCSGASGDFGLSSMTSTLNKQLSTGPLSTTLSSLQVPSSLQTGLNDLSSIAKVPFALYITGLIFAGLVILLSAFSFLREPSRLVTLVHSWLSSLAFAAFFASSIIITIVMSSATGLINMLGGPVGLQANSGLKYLALTWSATVIMGLGAVAGVAECCFTRRRVKDRGNGLLDEKGVVVRPGLLERVRGTGGVSIADRVRDRMRGRRRLSNTSYLTPV